MNIHPATKHDIPSLIEIGEACRLESGVYYPPIDPEVVAETFALCQKLPHIFAAIVADGGFIYGVKNPHPFSRETNAMIWLFLTHPRARSLSLARGLFEAFREWADGSKIVIGANTGKDLGLLLKRFGMTETGRIYEGY